MTVVHRTVVLQFVFCLLRCFGYRSSDDPINRKQLAVPRMTSRSTDVDIANSITAAVLYKIQDSSVTIHYTSVINNNVLFRVAMFPLLVT